MTNSFQYDLVIVGATGFVGGIVCRYLLSHGETEAGNNWAIAGRSQAKLDRLVQSLGATVANLFRFVVDATDEAALTALCSQTMEAAQAVGFYDLRFWGQTASGHSLMVKVTGDQDPGYGSTAKILAQAGLCLAKDKPKSSPLAVFGLLRLSSVKI